MKMFVIETEESRGKNEGWTPIAITTIMAENSYRALVIVSKQFTKHQYIHKITYEQVPWTYCETATTLLFVLERYKRNICPAARVN